jgi:hypothetical protein
MLMMASWAADQSEPLARLFGGGKAVRKAADYVCTGEHGLPPRKNGMLAENSRPTTRRVKPGQTQFNQDSETEGNEGISHVERGKD